MMVKIRKMTKKMRSSTFATRDHSEAGLEGLLSVPRQLYKYLKCKIITLYYLHITSLITRQLRLLTQISHSCQELLCYVDNWKAELDTERAAREHFS